MFPSPEKSSAASNSQQHRLTSEGTEFSLEERTILLKLAHSAIEAAGEKRAFRPEAPSPHLAEPRGVFTTVYLEGELHGCVGYVGPNMPLYLGVAETAVAAAFEDARFPALKLEEIPRLKISVSILSPLQPIPAEEVVIGHHGLVVSLDQRRGLLLPQVPVEHKWDRITFLEQTCKKAGLPNDAWRQGAAIEAFTAEVFGDGKL